MGSVHNEISRLETAKSDIEAAIEACGVPVPDTELISTYATYIRQIPSAVFSELNYDPVYGGDTYIKTIKQTNGLIEATTGGLVSTSQSGLTPKIENAAAAIAIQADEWVLTSNKGATPTWKRLPINSFKNDNTNTTYSLSGGLSGNNYIVTLTDSNSTPNTTNAIVPVMVGATSSVDGDAGLVPAPTTANANQYLKGDGTWATPTNTTYSKLTADEATTGTATTGRVITAKVLHDKIAAMLPTNYYSSTTTRNANTVLAGPTSGASASATFRALVAADIPSLASNKITALTGYSKATSASAISATNSLNTALGKLEFKADLGKSAYDIVSAAYDGDGTIENLAEILKVLEGISDTETIKNIVGKYLPLTGGTLTGNLTAPKFIGPLQGNADSATYATSSSTTNALNGLGANSESGATRAISSLMCLDTQQAQNAVPWGTGYNNAILSISRYSTSKYTSQLGFSATDLYVRHFNNEEVNKDKTWDKVLTSSNYATYGIPTSEKVNATAVSHTGYGTNGTYVPTMNFLSYWDGAYNSSHTSNLTYSANGVIIGTSNYTTYTVKKDGTGATGTWGISITGSAGSVAWSNVTGKPDSPFKNHGKITSSTTLTGLTTGIGYTQAYDPTGVGAYDYGELFTLKGTKQLTQIYFADGGRPYITATWDSTKLSSRTWKQIAFTSDIPTSLKNPNKLTLSAGAFAAKTYDGSSAVTVKVPTHTSHLTNDSDFITIDHTHNYAGSSTAGGAATSVVVGTGSSSAYRPIVVHNGNSLYSAGDATGKPRYNYSTGDVKAKSFTTDGGSFKGNLIGNVTGNLTGNVTGNVSGSSGSCTGNAATATAMSSFSEASSSDTKRYVWMSYNDNSSKPAYTGKLTFQTSTNTLFVNDKAVSVAGHTHGAGDITSGKLAIARIPTGTTATTVALGNHTHSYVPIKSVAFTPAETAMGPADVLSKLGSGTALGKGTWDYAGNGYISKDTTGSIAIDLAGCSVIQLGSSSAYTQLYITAPAISGTANAKSNEILFYNNHGSNYAPAWTRVLTNRNYSEYCAQAKHTHNYAGSSSAGGSATSAVSVVDYGNTSKLIQIGFAGTGLTSSTCSHLAGYTASGTKIKDITVEEVKKWLSLGSAAYTSSGNYATASHTHKGVQLSNFSSWDSATNFGMRQWATATSNRPADYGTVFDFKDPDTTWYHRLAFTTGGKIILYQGINTTTMTKIGTVSYDGHTHSGYATTASLANYLPLAGGTLTGNLTFKKATPYIYFNISGSNTAVFAYDGSTLRIGSSSYTTTIKGSSTTIDNTLTCRAIATSAHNTYNIGASGTRFKNGYFQGSVYAASGFFQSSDERLKEFFNPISVDLEKLKKLRKNYFKFKGDDTVHIGVSAQEIKELYPEIVSEIDNVYNVDYSKLAVIALKGIDALYDMILELKEENRELRRLANL